VGFLFEVRVYAKHLISECLDSNIKGLKNEYEFKLEVRSSQI